LEAAGKKRYGDQFSIQKKDQTIIYKLLIYAIGDKENMQKQGLNPHKDILLSGPVGCGNV